MSRLFLCWVWKTWMHSARAGWARSGRDWSSFTGGL